MKSKDQQLLEEAYNEVSKERLLSRIKPEFRKLYVKDLEHFNGSYRDRADVLNKAKQMGHLVEEAYGHVANRDKLRIDVKGETPNVFYSNRTINVQGQDVLVKQEWDRDEDSEWYYLSLVDPQTKKVALKLGTEEVEKILKNFK